MNTLLAKTALAIVGSLAMTAVLTAPLLAQDATDEERRDRSEGRRGEFLENNPEAAARMEERRAEREEFLENNPEAAARMEERRAHGRERSESGEGRQRPGRDFEGRREGRREGPPPGSRRGRGNTSDDV